MTSVDQILSREELTKDDIVNLLHLTASCDLQKLFDKADKVRKEYMGDIVHMRGIIEFSNHCARWCTYCGLNAKNTRLERYRMPVEEIVETAKKAHSMGYKTVVLQSGEDNYYTIEVVEDLIKRIKAEMDIVITLSMGERSDEEYKRMKEAGANRYLLKHETSDRVLYKKMHPDMDFDKRIHCLKTLKKLGFEVGSGIMIGLPGQSFESIADDILLFKELEIDMIGMGPYISHPETELYKEYQKFGHFTPDIDYDLEEMVYKVLAITRIVTKRTHLPATTALATTNPARGRELALTRGANVVMPNVTDRKYRNLYEIYPAKVCTDERPEDCRVCINNRICSIGRTPL
jgi:biotin synthase